MITVGQGMEDLSVEHSDQLSDSISTCNVNRGYYMLLLFLFVFLYFFGLPVCVCALFLCIFFSRDRNMISIGTIEFRYYDAIIIPVNVEKP